MKSTHLEGLVSLIAPPAEHVMGELNNRMNTAQCSPNWPLTAS